ncbi:Gag-pol fusion protein [Phytophthora megakarya]|uniref:Gag-pol fusion protein n=1 Tax=Phytophthora megakarya TaxID=4795 RepID=A0A225VZ99_9STRA|nr:Gag-pol fusion protein [Phytophthora megakarya]
MDKDRMKMWLNELDSDDSPLDDEGNVDIGTSEEDGRRMILKLLRVYRQLTKKVGDCLPATVLNITHHIDTGNSVPIMLKRCRQVLTKDELVDKNVTKMLSSGVIEECQDAWGFPVVLVRMKDGEVRFCVDYRALNKVTHRDIYPLPRIDETLEALSDALLFCTLDLKKAGEDGVYYQEKYLPVHTDVIRVIKCTVNLSTHDETCVTWINMGHLLIYLDDIVICTKGSIERHVLELACVVARLAAADLTLKLTKYGVRPLGRLVSAVRDFPRPEEVIEVKRFVHLAWYYRRFVEGFGAKMTKHMTKLLRKGVEWVWSTEQEAAFTWIKSVLTAKPLLVYPDFHLPFKVVTDACQVGLGSCTMENHGRGWQPVAFANELCGLLNYFRHTYTVDDFIVTDHSALKWLMQVGT